MVVLAKAILGKEFLYSATSCHEVSKSSADSICNALNKARYNLKEGEVWHRFNDFTHYSDGWTFAISQKFFRYNGNIREKRVLTR